MNIFDIKSELGNQLISLATAPSYGEESSTGKQLAALAQVGLWTDDQSRRLEFFCKKYDIAARLLAQYDANGRGIPDSGEVDSAAYEIFVGLLVLDLFRLYKAGTSEFSLRRLNTLYKLLDRVKPSWLSEQSDLHEDLVKLSDQLIHETPLSKLVSVTEPSYREHQVAKEDRVKTIPLTVLFYEGPIARAYLETLRSINLRPQKIVQLIPARDVQTGKRIGRWLPSSLRADYNASIHQTKIHYWPKEIQKKYPELCKSVFGEVAEKLDFTEEVQSRARSLEPLGNYSDDISQITIDGLSDDALCLYLADQVSGKVLFTGGGLVPQKLLNVPSCQLIHVHPGFLPHIRGADCILWSQLLSGHMSASCFYLAPGIDTGDVIRALWMPKLDFSGLESKYEIQTFYRSVFSFVDPWVRSYVLRSVLLSFPELDELPGRQQTQIDSGAYHFMHEKFLTFVLPGLDNA